MIGLMMMLAVPDSTGFVTGNELYERYQIAPDGTCLAYIEGVSDAVANMQSSGAISPIICAGPDVTAGQERDVVVKFVQDHPADRDESASSITAMALHEAFPCLK
jgi:hypothetical protein